MGWYTRKMKRLLTWLEAQSCESKNDIRWTSIVKYFNIFLKWFGRESVYVVGSTGEKTKLTNSKDGGDADFLMVSGVYEIDQEQLEFNADNACYLRILADDKSKAIGLETIEDKYIAANSLRDLKPELFTILRAIHVHVTTTRNCHPQLGSEYTVISAPSKVGLAYTRYRGLKLDDRLKVRLSKQNRFGNTCTRTKETTKALEDRWKNVTQHESDKKILHRVLKFICKVSKLREDNTDISDLSYATALLEGLMKRQDVSYAHHFSDGPIDTDSVANGSEEPISTKDSNVGTQDEDIDLEGMRNTYEEKSHMDFVPAIRLRGKLNSMNSWKSRAKNANMKSELIEDIYKMDVFVVSRIAPNNSNILTDFCLSFNIAELRLVTEMTSMQRKVFLIMKALLKSVFERLHLKNNRDLKLKTYHIKNMLFWLFELNPELSLADDAVENILGVTKRATDFLKEKLEKRMLPHYFVVDSNLFSDFEDEDYLILDECVRELESKGPVKCLQFYFDITGNDNKPSDIVFTAEENKCLLEISSDGGCNKHLDRLEDALVDLQRGFNQGPRDDEMRAPIKDAVLDILGSFLDKDEEIDTRIFKKLNIYLKLFKQGSTHLTATVISEYMRTNPARHFNAIKGTENFIKKIGGERGIEQLLRGAFSETPVDFSRPLSEQILEVMERYLSCPDEDEENTADELIYKLIGYFSGRKLYPDFTGLVVLM